MNRPSPERLGMIGQNVPIGIAQMIVGAVFDNVPVTAIGAVPNTRDCRSRPHYR